MPKLEDSYMLNKNALKSIIKYLKGSKRDEQGDPYHTHHDDGSIDEWGYRVNEDAKRENIKIDTLIKKVREELKSM